jgi:hypothetical protein
MKERFKALADECGLTIDSNNPEATWKEIEFFAEQIVKECIDIAHTNADVDETYDYACHTIAWKIEEHFGVKK